MRELKVALISNWHLQCGNAQYGRDLAEELKKQFAFESFDDYRLVTDSSVVIFNWHPSRVTLPPQFVHDLHARGKKVIIILQNSYEGPYGASLNDPCRYADAVVAHQKMEGSNVQITTLPHGIPVVSDLREVSPTLRIGIAGFPYAWKRFDITAKAAHLAGGRSLLIAPTHDMGDVNTPIQEIRKLYPTADIIRDWLSVEDVVRHLSSCTMNIFWFQHMPPDDLVGQSGSVRLGIAAKRPIIISEHPKLSSIREYADEVYVAKTEEQVCEYVVEIQKAISYGVSVRQPKRLLEDMGWDVVGRMYCDLVRKVAA